MIITFSYRPRPCEAILKPLLIKLSDLPYITRFKLFGAQNPHSIPRCGVLHKFHPMDAVRPPGARPRRIYLVHVHTRYIGPIGEVIKEGDFADPRVLRFPAQCRSPPHMIASVHPPPVDIFDTGG